MATVLIIEDDPDVRALERMALECGGYNVETASNGAEGLDSLRRQKPCLILLDLMMPIMDGLSFLAERRRTHTGEEIPVICISAAGPELMVRARQLGAAECVHKPSDFDELCGIVQRYCRGD